MTFYIIYGILALFSLITIILMILWKRYINLVLLIPTTGLSLYLFYMYIDKNYINNPCSGNPDCFNETGLFYFLALFIIFIVACLSFILVLMFYPRKKSITK